MRKTNLWSGNKQGSFQEELAGKNLSCLQLQFLQRFSVRFPPFGRHVNQ